MTKPREATEEMKRGESALERNVRREESLKLSGTPGALLKECDLHFLWS